MTAHEVAYQQGVEGFASGEECPYPPQGVGRKADSHIGSCRTAWWCGYLDARTDAVLGDVFRRHGLAPNLETKRNARKEAS